jgi:hypothetical protein
MIPIEQSAAFIASHFGLTLGDLKNKTRYYYWLYRKRITWILITRYSGRHVPLREISDLFKISKSNICYGINIGNRLLRKQWHDFTKLYLPAEAAYVKWISINYPESSLDDFSIKKPRLNKVFRT